MNVSDSSSSPMNDPLPPNEHAAWMAFLSVANRAIEQIDQALQKQSNMTLTDYEILRVLGEAVDGRLRMSELATQVHVSRSRLTYRVDRLAAVGFVTREECEDDRRGLWAILTDKGGEAVARATPGHHAEIRRLLFTALDRRSLGVFGTALQSMAYRLDGDS